MEAVILSAAKNPDWEQENRKKEMGNGGCHSEHSEESRLEAGKYHKDKLLMKRNAKAFIQLSSAERENEGIYNLIKSSCEKMGSLVDSINKIATYTHQLLLSFKYPK